MVFNRSSLLVALMCWAVSGFTQSFSGSTWAEVQRNGSGTIKILYLEEDAFAFTDAEGQLSGVEIDIFRQFITYVQKTRKVNLVPEFVKFDDFSKLYRWGRSSNGGVFVLGNITITEARKKEYQFSPPYLTNIGVLITHSSVPVIESAEGLSALKGFNAYSYTGTMHEDRLRRLKTERVPDLKIVAANSDTEIISRVEKDTRGMAYTDVGIYWMAQQQGKTIRRHPVGDDTGEEFGIAMPLNSDWEPLIREFFQLGAGGYRANPAYGRILRKYLGEEVTRMMELNIKKGQGR